MNVFSQCEYLKAIIMYALNSHQKEGGPYENDSIIFMSTELFFQPAAKYGHEVIKKGWTRLTKVNGWK